jgi:transposase, IS30 family
MAKVPAMRSIVGKPSQGADCMLFRAPGSGILVAHERRSRLTIAIAQQNLKADPIAQSLTQMLEPFAPDLRQSITFDNGTEFSRHQRIASQLAINT